jgi:hypothetical protein
MTYFILLYLLPATIIGIPTFAELYQHLRCDWNERHHSLNRVTWGEVVVGCALTFVPVFNLGVAAVILLMVCEDFFTLPVIPRRK